MPAFATGAELRPLACLAERCVRSLVIPVYRNEESLPELLSAIEGLDSSLGGDFEAVFVVDGSPDRCHAILREALPKASFPSQLLLLSRNFGSFAAIRSGLAAEGEPNDREPYLNKMTGNLT